MITQGALRYHALLWRGRLFIQRCQLRCLVSRKAVSHTACRVHATPMSFPCHAVPLRVWNVSFSFDLHSAAVSDSQLPCRAHSMLWPCRSSQGQGMVRAWHGRCMESVNQTRPHCVNQMGKTHSKHLAARRGMVGERHGHGMLCVNRPLVS